MEQKHTDEHRWRVENRTLYALNDAGTNHFYATFQPDGRHAANTDELKANAERARDCVVALAGIPDPAALLADVRKVLEKCSTNLQHERQLANNVRALLSRLPEPAT